MTKGTYVFREPSNRNHLIVAQKMSGAADDEWQMLLREWPALQQLQYPNIVTMLGVVEKELVKTNSWCCHQ